MATELRLTAWDADMQDGAIVKWLKKEGDTVHQGEPLVEVESAKITTELEAPASGVLARIQAPEGTKVRVDSLLALIAAPGEDVPLPPPESPPPAPILRPVAEGAPLTGIRRTIAERMMHSMHSMAQLTLTTEVDVTEAERLRQQVSARYRGHHLRPLHLVIKATAQALQDHPRVNATLHEGRLSLLRDINVGVAIAMSEGLIVPIIPKANEKGLLEIAQEVRQLGGKARNGTLTHQDVTGGSFTVSTLASYDIDAFTPIINPPQVAILGVGRIAEKPAVYRGEIAIRSTLVLSISFDHQALDGAPAGAFLRTVKRYLEEPWWMDPS